MPVRPGVDVTLRSTFPEASAWFRHVAQDQLPFAMALGVTWTARAARDRLRANLARHFRIRSSRVGKGIRSTTARKGDFPRPTAQVGTLDEFMALHALGGIKRAERGAQRVAIPTSLVKRTGTGKVPARLKPRRLRDRKGAGVTEDGFLVARKGRRKGSPRLVWYTLRDQVRIERTWPLREEAIGEAEKEYPELFRRALLRAFDTRRR